MKLAGLNKARGSLARSIHRGVRGVARARGEEKKHVVLAARNTHTATDI